MGIYNYLQKEENKKLLSNKDKQPVIKIQLSSSRANNRPIPMGFSDEPLKPRLLEFTRSGLLENGQRLSAKRRR